jgi:hypothetical protein
MASISWNSMRRSVRARVFYSAALIAVGAAKP